MYLTIGAAIKATRTEKGLKAKYVAEKLDISPSTLCKYENDERQVPAMLLLDLARIYKCDAGYFFEKIVGDSPTKSA